MKKIITALDNPRVNYELNKLGKYEIIGKDICYQEGIFEILQKENPDILLLSEILSGELNIKELILKIKEKNKNIEIIIFLEKENEELIKFLKINEIYNIFYNNKITIKELSNKIEKKKEIFDIKNILNKNKSKIISIIGPSGSGKTLFTLALSKTVSKNKKVLVLDFDLLSNDIKLVFKKSKNLDIILGQDIMFKKENIEFLKIKEIIEQYKKEYDLIIIDTSSECYFKFNKKLIKLSDKSLFITGTNIIEIKKSKTLLNIYISEWGIQPEKINIILNKYNAYSIDDKILLNIFKNYKIIGKIKFTESYKFSINNSILKKIDI